MIRCTINSHPAEGHSLHFKFAFCIIPVIPLMTENEDNDYDVLPVEAYRDELMVSWWLCRITQVFVSN